MKRTKRTSAAGHHQKQKSIFIPCESCWVPVNPKPNPDPADGQRKKKNGWLCILVASFDPRTFERSVYRDMHVHADAVSRSFGGRRAHFFGPRSKKRSQLRVRRRGLFSESARIANILQNLDSQGSSESTCHCYYFSRIRRT